MKPKAVEYLNRAAEQGNQFAQYTLGKLHLMGREVKYDKELALHWLSRSAAQGNEYAQFFFDRIDQFREPSAILGVMRLFHLLGGIFQSKSASKTNAVGVQVDSKLRKKIREKKIAQGHKADDHEEHAWGGMTMG